MKISPDTIALFNQNLRHEDPSTIISFVLRFATNPIITTSFGAYSAAIIHAVYKEQLGIKVLWCDTGYNTPKTYSHMDRLTNRFDLNIDVLTPKFTTAYLDYQYGRPKVGTAEHKEFSDLVKIEPIKKAIDNIQPDLWFTNIRSGQTQFRDGQDILSFSEQGILKVSPFYHFTNKDLFAYLTKHQLPVEFDYHDPIKAEANRECGIHLSI